MAKKHLEKPQLTLVGLETGFAQPPFALGKHGRSLWDRIQSEYDVSDSAGIEMLAQACAGADLAEQLHEEVVRDGAVIRIRGAVRAHPAVKDEIAARSFVVRTLVKLGLNFEPVRASAGRPGGGLGWTGS
jgi:hypothetical protein